jgi:hypothetical protein
MPTGGKLLVLYGGLSKSTSVVHEAAAREVAILNMETMMWDRPSSARTLAPSLGHTSASVGRTKMLIFGGVRSGDQPTAEVSIFNTDTMKWTVPQIKGTATAPSPVARSGHACASIREKVFVFGGATVDGTLLNDVWILDQDSMTWNQVTCFGTVPSARRGDSLWCFCLHIRSIYPPTIVNVQLLTNILHTLPCGLCAEAAELTMINMRGN